MSQGNVYDWVEMFKSRRTSEYDKVHGSQQKNKVQKFPLC